MLNDKELDALIDEINDQEADQFQVDEDIRVITVHGRIASAPWLETEYGAKKQKNGKYYEYYLEVPANAQETTDLFRRLQEAEEDGMGIWFKDYPKI